MWPLKIRTLLEIDADFIFITEKDAVKCSAIEDRRIWVVPMHLPLSNELRSWVQEVIQRPDPYRR
jgi:tetraacyldisaccharide 4'-kinase